ncbi:MAG: hypothetical protein AAGE13_15565, partial [Pseudomonadota bacterium]
SSPSHQSQRSGLSRSGISGRAAVASAADPIRVLGATIFVLAQNYLQTLMGSAAEATAALPLIPDLLNPDRWLLWLGLLFILSVYYFPSGIVGRLRAGR